MDHGAAIRSLECRASSGFPRFPDTPTAKPRTDDDPRRAPDVQQSGTHQKAHTSMDVTARGHHRGSHPDTPRTANPNRWIASGHSHAPPHQDDRCGCGHRQRCVPPSTTTATTTPTNRSMPGRTPPDSRTRNRIRSTHAHRSTQHIPHESTPSPLSASTGSPPRVTGNHRSRSSLVRAWASSSHSNRPSPHGRTVTLRTLAP